MKKIITITLTILLLFSMLCLSSCDSILQKIGLVDEKPSEVATVAGKTPKELMQTTTEVLNNTTNYTSKTKQVISYSSNGQVGQSFTNTTIKSDGNNSYILVDTNGYTSMEVWYVDGMCYISTQGQKVKAPLSIEEYKEHILESNVTLESLIDPEDAQFDNAVFKAKGDYWTITFSVDSEIMEKIYQDVFGITGITFDGDINFTWYFDDDGNLIKNATAFDYTMNGIKMKSESVVTYDFAPVTISPPDDANSFTLDNSIV